MNLCLFDLDHTLLPIDSDHAWGEFVIGLGWVDEEAFRRGNDAFYAQYQAGRLDIDAYVAFASAPLREHGEDELATAHRRFMDTVIVPAIRPAALELVRRHRDDGDRLALVTSTNDFVTAPIAAAFGIDALIATRLQRDAAGRFTGRIEGTPAFREGKVARVGQWLAESGASWADFERVAVYSDSLNDLALLERATEPVATNPAPELAALARERGWRIMEAVRMIKKFIEKFLGKKTASPGAAKRVEVSKAEHGIDPKLVDERAVKVVQTLADAGYEAYVVGGAVRDLLVGLRPKDFDVATNATPEQVKGLFRRAFIIGRRFRIVHVVFGRGRQDRGLSEVIEVSTFRARPDAAAADLVSGNEKTSKSELAGKSHVVDAEGRVLRDNVWGPQIEDAERRDFTINAMYYDPIREVVVDYHGGIKDVKKKLLRMIGDPVARYREDPVRIIRAVRFAAKLGFEIEAKTRAPIKEMAALLDNVPQSRTFDEMIKLLQTGHALASIVELKKLGLHRGVFPVLDVALDEAQRHDGREKFVRAALADTDVRVAAGKPVAPSFMLAAMLWHDVLEGWTQRQAAGEATFPALQNAIDAAFDARIGDISGRGKLAVDMREIWMLQPRFERRASSSALTLLEQPRFRAGLDFLRLRGEIGEADPALAAWWESLYEGNDEERQRQLESVRETRGPRRVRKAAAPAPAAGATRSVAAASDDHEAPVGESEAADGDDGPAADPAAPRKRRRRRRKPADAGPPT